MKNQKGITLIALVITIIVLLILAGVSIAMLTGQNGILTQANNAQTATRDADIKEAINLAVSTINVDLYDNVSAPEYTALDYANIAKAINADRGANTASAISGGIKFTYGNKDYDATFTISDGGIQNNAITIAPHADE